jgi:hypothetical protein
VTSEKGRRRPLLNTSIENGFLLRSPGQGAPQVGRLGLVPLVFG